MKKIELDHISTDEQKWQIFWQWQNSYAITAMEKRLCSNDVTMWPDARDNNHAFRQ